MMYFIFFINMYDAVIYEKVNIVCVGDLASMGTRA